MISDEDILFHLDELIANEESEDEFIDDINFDIMKVLHKNKNCVTISKRSIVNTANYHIR